MNNLTKSDFRKICIERLKRCAKFGKLKKSKRIEKEILKIIKDQRAQTILVYIPLGSEFNTLPLIDFLRKAKKKVFVPYMVGKTLKMVPFRLPLFRKKYGLYEPHDSNQKQFRIDIAIVPIVGTDGSQRRVGFGVGFYDRFFASLSYRPKIIFTQLCRCYSHTILTQIHDIKSDYFITDKGIQWKKQSEGYLSLQLVEL